MADLTFLTKAEADTLKQSRTPPARSRVIPIEVLGYCKETGKLLIRDGEGVQEVSDTVIRSEEGSRWYERFEP